MKAKHILLLLVLIILSSCYLKSLHPFYTKDSIYFEKSFIGNWIDDDDKVWNVYSFKDKYLGLGRIAPITIKDLDKEELEQYNQIKNNYYVETNAESMGENKNKESFLVVLFKIENELFLDFSIWRSPAIDKLEGLSNANIIGTHTLMKFDLINNNEINLTMLDEGVLKDIIDENRIKINYEIIGNVNGGQNVHFNDKGYLLTASSEDLEKFLKKYVKSNDFREWRSSEYRTKFKLKRTNGK
jgi:hypothetical protein